MQLSGLRTPEPWKLTAAPEAGGGPSKSQRAMTTADTEQQHAGLQTQIESSPTQPRENLIPLA